LAAIPLLFLALAIGWVAVITLAGFSLSTCAIVTEKKLDSFDGFNCAAAYIYQRPLQLILAIGLAEFVSWVAGDFIAMVFNAGYLFVVGSLEFSAGESPLLPQLTLFIGFGIKLLLSAFAISLFWSVSSIIYLFLRRDIDHAEYDLVDMNISEFKTVPEITQTKPTAPATANLNSPSATNSTTES
jgi:hypothetical protein